VGRADELRAGLEAELAVVELEDELVAAKEAGLADSDPEAYRDVKERLREARRAFREARSGVRAGEGDAVASPAAIDASASVQEG